MARVDVDGEASLHVESVPDLVGVVTEVRDGRLCAAAVDMPIGLPDAGPRQVDIEVRRRLGPRRASVWPAPARSVLGAASYAEACARSRRACGKALSKQLFHILPKIAEVDALVDPGLQDRLAEMCPEWSLAVLSGAPMAHAKSVTAGRVERAAVLGSVFGHDVLERHLRRPPAGAKADDVLDAVAGAWTARRVARGTALRVGGELDARGLRMEAAA